MNYIDTLNYIHSLGNFGLPAGLKRIKAVLNALGSPQKNIKAIHIAGTNGKGSVSAMLATVFKEAGYKTGLFISPFIINFRERIQINGEYISEEDLCFYAQRVKAVQVELTEFEFITALAFLYFKEKNIDILICETGLGGRLDATNSLENKIAAIITKIGLDHTAVLGTTFEEIATEKCGIIKNCPVITNPCQYEKALEVIKRSAEELIIPDMDSVQKAAEDTYIYKGEKYILSLKGDFQIENAVTVIETVKRIFPLIPYNIIYKGIANTFFPARMESISINPIVMLDGAHNPDGAAALANELKKYSGKVTAVIGMMRDKDYKDFLKATLCHCKAAVAVGVKGMERSLTSEELSESANTFCECVAADSYKTAIEKAEALSGGEPIFVFGSLYLASAIREELKKYFN